MSLKDHIHIEFLHSVVFREQQVSDNHSSLSTMLLVLKCCVYMMGCCGEQMVPLGMVCQPPAVFWQDAVTDCVPDCVLDGAVTAIYGQIIRKPILVSMLSALGSLIFNALSLSFCLLFVKMIFRLCLHLTHFYIILNFVWDQRCYLNCGGNLDYAVRSSYTSPVNVFSSGIAAVVFI